MSLSSSSSSIIFLESRNDRQSKLLDPFSADKELLPASPPVKQFAALKLSSDDYMNAPIKVNGIAESKRVKQAKDNPWAQNAAIKVHTKVKMPTRRRIRKIKSVAELNAQSRLAIKTEKDRCKRVNAKQVQLAELFDATHEVVLDFDPQTKQRLVQVHDAFVPLMKPHQVEGVRFLYDCTIETLQQLNDDPKGSGCILAHSMGLGKTFQVIVFLHTVLNHNDIAAKLRRVLIVVPLNVIQNWVSEFHKWMKQCRLSMPVRLFEMRTAKTASKRVALLTRWHQEGGIMFVSIATFRSMLTTKCHQDTAQVFTRCLLKPGPDLTIFDEGHLLKDDKSQISQCASKIETGRRVILTGTPLQNNLAEVFVMFHFIKPNLLGDKEEFLNRFKNPIDNGQHKDSSEHDVRLMKRRIFVLKQMLQSCIHRCGYDVLMPYLKPKKEYVLIVKLTPEQITLYRHYLHHYAGLSALCLFRDKSILELVWNHPALLHHYYKKCIRDEQTRSLYMVQIGPEWFRQVVPLEAINKIELSVKFQLLFRIIELCESVGDKLVVFSQSLLVLDQMERFLEAMNWHNGSDYFRMDGSVNCEERSYMIDSFNETANLRTRLMLVSTRAGGIGVNLVGANRAVVFDSSFNPANDVQAIFRVYRLGQHKPVYVYRLVACGTMEEKIYKRQVVKQSLSSRVVDEHHVARHFTKSDILDLFKLNTDYEQQYEALELPEDDSLLSSLLAQYSHQVLECFEHDSLLENLPEHELSDGEQKQAWHEVGVNN